MEPTHKIIEKKEWFEFEFPYRKVMVDLVKHHFPAPLRKFDPINKVFKVDIVLRSKVEVFAEKYKFQFVDAATQRAKWTEYPPLPQLQVNELQFIKRKLYPFQAEGVAYCLDKKGAMNGDDMGLGKTTQAIATTTIANAFPALVICPSSLKLNWQEEWLTVAGKESIILQDNIRRTWPNLWKVMGIGVFIVNYESLRKYFVVKVPGGDSYKVKDIEFSQFIKLFKTVIIDEAHKIKDWTTQQSKFSIGIAQNAEYRMLLSGTFVVNNPKDLIAPLSVTGALHSEFGGYKKFVDTFCPGGRATNLLELGYRLRKSGFYMRMKKDVLKDLPDKTRQVIHVHLSNQAEYDKAERDFVSFLEDQGKSDEQISKAVRAQALVQIGILKMLSAKGKLEAVIEYIQEAIAAGKKVIIFCWHLDIVNVIISAIPGAVALTGEQTLEVRQQNKNRFQNDPSVTAIVTTIKAGGVGHTLTAASLVLFIEFGWNPMHHDQAEDRAYRIGVKDNVLCCYFTGRNTIDDHIYKIIETKREMVEAINGGGDDIQTSVLDDLINIYKK
ncbi:SWI/SNF-related matrix-associated actin-dependent regulator of chromatin subfamily A-like protein 1 [Chitinophaga sp. YR573]|uniref:DEAD/DEAH box helicase n=1 Tax=Chitinophaga sp. YR573 TaxID=1881040 RepID=UPI0008B105E7|nr:DEAD/DEAH box helicase [Chitinophaga sp. YR573]SEV88574.1 SWI/SNF-related matrix-associated actin-dependent regulator of chromatin subfamily A-like protein 1 [Chitinophaga sp. YR573]